MMPLRFHGLVQGSKLFRRCFNGSESLLSFKENKYHILLFFNVITTLNASLMKS